MVDPDPLHPLKLRRSGLRWWPRIKLAFQETPVQLAIALLAMVNGISNLILYDFPVSGTWGHIAAWLFIVGGLGNIIGRFWTNLYIELIGIILLLGSLVFLTLFDLSFPPLTALTVTGIFSTTGALALGFTVRLLVVRKAIKTEEKIQLSQMKEK